MVRKELIQISKRLSYILRHAPEKYGLELDEKGWVLVQDMLRALRNDRKYWTDVTLEDLQAAIASSDKQRHEIQNGKIRAIYGHSISEKIIKSPAIPPEILFHGTDPAIVETIQAKGLKPMSRQYVHLSADVETAIKVGKRKAQEPVILKIKARQACQNGTLFYQESNGIWLADVVPAEYIDFNRN